MSAVVVGVNRVLYPFTSGGHTISQAAVLAVTIAAGLATLTIGGRVLQIGEFAALRVEVRRRVRMLLDRG